ncbi:putative optic atrophy protein family [Babesia divergens]|uniref:Optic atrophy protein family n=1 Tax=Babesia divergens TaxID=32595 RepID=A0AAD9LI49_BABDI|nr:putative optic atrophy protein family [Babesia divergens]
MIPAFKLLTVFVKQLSKPLASYLKKRASNSDRFRRLCISIGNRGYAFDRYITRRFYNPEQGEPDTTPWLSPEKSVVIGTEMFGEVILFGVATLLVISEYARSVRKENKKEAKLQERLNTLENRQSMLEKYVREELERRSQERLADLSALKTSPSRWGFFPF